MFFRMGLTKSLGRMILFGTALFSFGAAQGVTYTGPGVMLDYQALSYGTWYYSTTSPEVFISDPEILVLSNGTYLASHALAGWDSDSDSTGETTVFRSTDKGSTWAELTTISGVLRASMVEYNGAVYLLGAKNDDGGGMRVCKSTDQGGSWSKSSEFSISGLATPNNPVVYNDRLWTAGGAVSYFAPVSSNFLTEASWTRKTGFPSSESDWLSGTAFIGEGQIVASPDTGLHILPKVKQYPYTALASIDASVGTVSFDPDSDFVSLPGGEKKFGATYDSVSSNFYVLSNPIPLEHADSSMDTDMIRNTAALLSSTDLRNWNVEKILIYSTDEEKDGFGYMNCDFDGDDMVFVSRTAFPVGSNDPERGHDSNLLTFHVIKDFRTASPSQVLKLSGSDVLRYEKTDYEDAPLGSFALGSSFDGSALASPDGFGQDSDGDVYISESGGRILRFDASGNFLETTTSSPVTLQTSQLSIDQPSDDACAWISSTGGDWFTATNWYYWGRADSADEIAVFGSALMGAASFTVDDTYTLGGFRFLTENACTFTGDGNLEIEGSNAGFDVEQGDHEIGIPVALSASASFFAEEGSSLTFTDDLDFGHHSLTVSGPGTLKVQNGTVEISGQLILAPGGSVYLSNATWTVSSTIEFEAPDDFDPSAGDSFHIVNGDLSEDVADRFVLPDLEDGLGWDTSELLTDGDVSVILKVPEDWMSQYGLAADGSEDFVDSDGDGADNYSEWETGSDPTDALSFFYIKAIYSSDYREDGSLGADGWWVETAGQGVISNGYVSVEDKATYSFGDTYALNENVEADYNVDALWVSFSVKVPTEGNDGRAIIALGNSEYYVNADGTDDQYEFGKFGGVWLYDTALRTEAKTMCAGRLSTYVAAFPSTFMNFVLKISETNDQLQVQMWYNPADLDNLGNPQKTNIKPYDDKYTGMGYQGLFDQIELNAYNFTGGMQISSLVVWIETVGEGYDGFAVLNGLSGVKTDDNDLDGLADYGEYVFGGNPTNGADAGVLPQFDAISGDYSFSLIGDDSVTAHVMTNSDLVAGTWGTHATVSVTASDGVLSAYTNSVGIDASQVFIKLIVE
jgi:hypothetical protein